MKKRKLAIIGAGPIGAIAAGLLLNNGEDVTLVDILRDHLDAIKSKGLEISGVINTVAPIREVRYSISQLSDSKPDLVFIAVKASSLMQVISEIQKIYVKGMKLICLQNGLDNEELVAETFGADNTLRVVINYAGNLLCPGKVQMTFFNKPNYVGAMTDAGRETARYVADTLTAAGLDTQYTDNIKKYEWEKVILNSALMPVSAITGMTMKEVMDFEKTRQLVEENLRECIAVARMVGHDYGTDFFDRAIAYFLKAGHHKPSMIADLEAKRPTEIDFLNGKIVYHGQRHGIPTPYNTTMTNLVKALEMRGRDY